MKSVILFSLVVVSCFSITALVVAAESPQSGVTSTRPAPLLVSGYIAEAKNWLQYARMNLGDNENDIRYINEYLDKAGAKLADVGTSEEELDRLLTSGYIAEAGRWLEYAKMNLGNNESCVRYINEYLDKAVASYEKERR